MSARRSAPAPAPDGVSDPTPRTRLSPEAFRVFRVLVVALIVLTVGGGISVALGGQFASLPVALVAAVCALRAARAPVRT